MTPLLATCAAIYAARTARYGDDSPRTDTPGAMAQPAPSQPEGPARQAVTRSRDSRYRSGADDHAYDPSPIFATIAAGATVAAAFSGD